MLIGDVLQGQRIRLDAIHRDDLSAIVGWWQDNAALRHFDAIPARPRTLEQVQRWADAYNDSDKEFRFAVRRLSDEQIIGVIEIDGILWHQRVGWISLMIGDGALRGQGYGQEAMEIAMRFAFHELNLHRLQLSVFAYNTNAIALYERLGFQREGAMREFMERDGQRYDMLLFGLLRNEWQAMHAASTEADRE
ncbi:MAG: GNAT family N-acetyltransferase [Thermomicrobiales bacterium]|nr:GNAT family N-acetyltransferase [Thermomicrobiales bacterium]